MSRRSLIGRDLARAPGLAQRPSALPWVLIGSLIAALALAALRVDVLRLRYASTRALKEERALQEQRRALSVRVQSARDPLRLATLARELGFERPGRAIDLRAAPAGSGGR